MVLPWLDSSLVATEDDRRFVTSSYNKVVFWIAPEGQLRYNASSG